MDLLFTIIGVIGGLVGIATGVTGLIQWKKVSKKVSMISESSQVFEILPAWYSTRMLKDQWLFGLQMSDGSTIVIETIDSVSSDGVWMDVQLAGPDRGELAKKYCERPIAAIATDRKSASVQINSIVVAYELGSS